MAVTAGIFGGSGLNSIQSVGSNYNLSGLPPDVALEEQALNRKQQIANLLLQRGLQGTQGQMAGRFYVAPSWAQGVAQLGSALAGTSLGGSIDTQRKDLAQRMRDERARAIQDYAKNTKAQEVPVQGPGAPELTSLGQQLNKDMALDPRLLSQPEMQALAERTGDVVQEGPRPAVTQEVPLTPDDHRQKVLAALSHQDPRVQQAAMFIERLKTQEEEKQAQRAFLANQGEENRAVRREGIEANALMRVEQIRGNMLMTQAQIDAREQAGRDANDLKKELARQNADLQKTLHGMDIQGRKDVAKIGADAKIEAAGIKAGSKGKVPSAIGSKFMENSQNLRMAENALTLIGKNPNSTGVKGYLPDPLLQRVDPSGVDARAAVANLGSMIIHDRSGAAVTAAEFPRLRPFIPAATDAPDVVEKKLKQFIAEYKNINEEMTDFYRQSGYDIPENWHQAGGAAQAPSAQPVAPTATGPNGEKLILKDGQWQPVQ